MSISKNQKLDNRPTYLFLPGVNRGWVEADHLTKALYKANIPFVNMNFSPHAFSIAQLPPLKRAAFELTRFTLKDLAQEVNFVKETLRETYPIDRIIPVSLSYSGLMSPYLDDSTIIDTAPLTSAAVAYPEMENYRLWLKSLESLNPIFGSFWTRLQLDIQYRNHWSEKVDEFISTFNLPPEKRIQMIEGQVSLSRAAEGQSWNASKFNSKIDRTLILGGKESRDLLVNQLEVIKSHWDQGTWTRLVFVPEAGHVIPAETPKLYLKILEYLDLTRQNQKELLDEEILIITHSADQETWESYTKESAALWVTNKLIQLQ